jgi:hypothetical protein
MGNQQTINEQANTEKDVIMTTMKQDLAHRSPDIY